ncbi:MAG TPA: RagB/SusD family nutrient uptake outer membrane protein [Panacibacter sp.]|nr:RagB/SusD family nutrient uptake outer membrane protein [Panacibacter sp.]HNP46659.1 RagB/SusD family nutrient uptake outer membrane protein [Panacibacter sp.]
MRKLNLNIKTRSRNHRPLIYSAALLFLLSFGACKKQLDVQNPNSPTFGGNVNSVAGLAKYAKGGIYWNGFNYGDGWLGDSYFSLPWGYHELMGDMVGGGQGSNNQTTTMGVPDKFIADPTDPSNTTFVNTTPQVSIIRSFNTAAATASANNALYYQWTNMYAMINACNIALENMGNISMTADQASTFSAWCYWWKGFAYAELGTLYYAGLIVDQSNTIVNKYVSKEELIVESNRNLDLAASTLSGIGNQGDYAGVMAQLIPQQCQAGLGMPMSTTEWLHSINTMKARNILMNHLAPFVNGNPAASISKSSISPMSASDWSAVIDLCNNGVKEGENVFTGRTSGSNSFFNPTWGSVASMLSESNQTTTYKLSERWVQQYHEGDKRLANFTTANGTFYGDANTNTTRYSLVDAVTEGLSLPQILGTREVGQLEIYIGPSYEENQLMLAEAKIRSNDIAGGVALINAVRHFQGANVADLSGSLTLSQAMTELTMERLAALAMRGLSFYDLRRWGWTYAISSGGGRYGCTILYGGKVYTNGTIDYNFMDYWDVPADETDKNPPSEDSAPVRNANY